MKRAVSFCSAALFAGLVVLAAGCTPPPSGPRVCPVHNSGTWVGTWQSVSLPVPPNSGDVASVVDFNGSSVSGTAQLTNNQFSSGDVNGTVNCNRVALGLFDGVVTFKGKISSDGGSITGTYVSPIDKGVFDLTYDPNP